MSTDHNTLNMLLPLIHIHIDCIKMLVKVYMNEN